MEQRRADKKVPLSGSVWLRRALREPVQGQSLSWSFPNTQLVIVPLPAGGACVCSHDLVKVRLVCAAVSHLHEW